MSEVSVWFERRFTFDFPPDLFPNLRVRLQGTPVRLEELTRGVPADLLREKRSDAWSLQEHAGHLLDLEPLWGARVDDFRSGAERLTPAELENRRTHEAGHNDRSIDEILGAFRKARGALVARLEGVAVADYALSARHPRLDQPMRFVDHLFFVAEHDDHHLARIRELARPR